MKKFYLWFVFEYYFNWREESLEFFRENIQKHKKIRFLKNLTCKRKKRDSLCPHVLFLFSAIYFNWWDEGLEALSKKKK